MKRPVLIIDDETDFCSLVHDHLTKLGFDVFSANSLSAGLRLLDEKEPGTVLLDNNLPDGFGWREAPAIHKRNPDIRILLISGHESTVITTTVDGVAFPVIEKPLKLANLEKYL